MQRAVGLKREAPVRPGDRKRQRGRVGVGDLARRDPGRILDAIDGGIPLEREWPLQGLETQLAADVFGHERFARTRIGQLHAAAGHVGIGDRNVGLLGLGGERKSRADGAVRPDRQRDQRLGELEPRHLVAVGQEVEQREFRLDFLDLDRGRALGPDPDFAEHQHGLRQERQRNVAGDGHRRAKGLRAHGFQAFAIVAPLDEARNRECPADGEDHEKTNDNEKAVEHWPREPPNSG